MAKKNKINVIVYFSIFHDDNLKLLELIEHYWKSVFSITVPVHLGDLKVASYEHLWTCDIHATQRKGWSGATADMLTATQASWASRLPATGASQSQHGRPRRAYLSSRHWSHLRLLRLFVCRWVKFAFVVDLNTVILKLLQ